MMRNETFRDGVCVYAEIIDLDAGTVTIEQDGVAVSTRALTAEEREAFGPPPPTMEDRLAELEREVRGIKERAAAAQVAGDAKKVRDAVVGE